MTSFKRKLKNNDKFNDRLLDDEPVYYVKYFENFFHKRIKYIYKDEYNRILVVNTIGLSVWSIINNTLYFNYYISNKHHSYEEFASKLMEEFK